MPVAQRRAAHAGGRRGALRMLLVSGGLAASLRTAPLRAADAEPMLERIDDLQRLAVQSRRERKPLLLFFSTPGCAYCREARRSYLAPRAAERNAPVLIREVSIVADRRFVGIDGLPMTERQLAARFEVTAVPVVRLVDAQLRPLAEPLIGLNAAFYESYLQAAIDQASQALARP